MKPEEKLKAEQAKADLQWLLADPRGRRVVRHWLFDIAGLHRSVFSTNALSMAQSAGFQAMGLAIETELSNASVEGYSQLLAEHIKEAANV